jgi:hypothetical protein
MDRRDNARFRSTAKKSVFYELHHRDAILTVARDQVVVLRPQDTQYAIGIQDLSSYCCLVLIGTSPRPAIMMARICTSDGEEHYMSLLRLMIRIFMEEQELFRLPRAWGIFGHGQKDDVQINLLTHRTARVFQHLNVPLEITFRASQSEGVAHPLRDQLTVVAVRHEPEVPEIYVEGRLLYPKVHSGSLALAYHTLGLRQVDYEHGDEEES